MTRCDIIVPSRNGQERGTKMRWQRRRKIAYSCFILFVFLCSFPALPAAAATPVLSAALKPSSDGKTVTVVFSVENNPGIAAFRFTMHYDNKILKPASAAMNGKISGFFSDNHDSAAGAFHVVWANGTNYTGNGELCGAVFSVTGTVKDGKYPVTVTYDPVDIINKDGNPVTFGIKGMTASAMTVSAQSAQSTLAQSSIASSQAKSSSAAPVSSSAVSSYSSSAGSAITSAPSVWVNSQIQTPDTAGSAPSGAIPQSSPTVSSPQNKSGENNQTGSSAGTDDASDTPALQSSGNQIPVRSSGGESPILLYIAVSVIAAAAVIVLTVLIIKKKKQP